MTQADEARQSTSSSPTKRTGKGTSSPTKSKNKRRNDAKRRNSGNYSKRPNNEQSEQNIEAKSLASPSKSPQPEAAPSVENLSSTSQPLPATNMPTEQEQGPENHQLAQLPSTNRQDVTYESNKDNSMKKQIDKTANDNIRDSKEYRDLKEQLKMQNLKTQTLVDQFKHQLHKTKELEAALLRTNRTCNQLEKILEQEMMSRSNMEAENVSLQHTVSRLKKQLAAHEKSKFNSDELMRVLNATLMERETEISLLKLRLTRIQTNPSSTNALNSASSVSSVKQEPSQVFATTGRSNSEFDRNSYVRSSMIAEAASVRASTSQLRSTDRDASVWATVPEELTPSKRPIVLCERSFQPIYDGSPYYNPYGNINQNTSNSNLQKPFERDRRYRTLPLSMKSPSQEFKEDSKQKPSNEASATEARSDLKQETLCQVTNLDDSNSTNQSSIGNRTVNSSIHTEITQQQQQQQEFCGDQDPIQTKNQDSTIETTRLDEPNYQSASTKRINRISETALDESHYSTISKTNVGTNNDIAPITTADFSTTSDPPSLPMRTPTTPVKFSYKMKKIFDKFRRSDSSTHSSSKTDLANSTNITPTASPFKRGATRSTMVASPNNIRSQMSPTRHVSTFQTDKPFAEWDTGMLVDWLTMIGLSMYTSQCRRWVKCGAHIMNATPAEVDKGLGITNHLHRKKLRLAISELNGDCDKITKAAAKLDYLWVARWLDDIGLPQYKEAFIDARVDGRVLNYLTIDDLISLGVKSVLHHASLKCGIRVLRSIQFDVQQLKRRATADEIEEMNSMRRHMNQVADNPNGLAFNSLELDVKGDTELALWTCHRVMEWLRLIDFAEFAPNLRGSGVHGGLIVFEDGFNIDTMCSLLSIPMSRTLLRRHLSTFFKELVGSELAERKRQCQNVGSSQQLNPLAEIKTPKKSQLWFPKMKGSKVSHDGMDEYLCPMYPVEPNIIKRTERKKEADRKETQLSRIPESINI